MEDLKDTTTIITSTTLHTSEPLRRTVFNRVFALVYTCGIVALMYHHAQTILQLLHSTESMSYLFIHLFLLISDLVLAFMWTTTQSFRIRPVRRREFPENLSSVLKSQDDFPCLDVFICTADPYKEPPMGVANTALSVMAYDYPTKKISVYVSDDGGSKLTLFAFMEAAKFARHWIPFCKKNNIEERSPHEFFQSKQCFSNSETDEIKMMYEKMKFKVEQVVDTGNINHSYISSDEERQIFSQWTHDFTRQDHPAVIQVLLDKRKDKDITGHLMPNLVYVSRQKSRASHHHFKAGALNVLLRVSATMTNAPIILTLDCDMNSNNPQTPFHALCYLSDPAIQSKLGYVQFPQRFRGINKGDIYAGEFRRLFQIQPVGFDGLSGPNHVGTGCFFSRRAFFGCPSTLVQPEIPELGPDHVVEKPIRSNQVLALAHHVSGCDYENNTKWGSKIGVRYGSLVEDYYTGYILHCEGWKSVFCNPDKIAFIGDAPISLMDALNQNMRWSYGLLEVGLSKHSPIIYGSRFMGPVMGLAYAHYAFWPIWSIPINVYAFLPQLAFLNGINVFPEVTETWFPLYAFLFLGTYFQDFIDFYLSNGTFQMWWNDQRLWMIKGVTSYSFASVEFLCKSLGISTFAFNVTSKVLDDEQNKRYDQGVFEFGTHSPMFVLLAMASIINLVSFVSGLIQVFTGRNSAERVFSQIFLAGFVVVNSWPIYDAMVLRRDKGSIPTKTTAMAVILSSALYMVAFLFLG